MKKKNKLVHGVGINDFEGSCKEDGKNSKSYYTWTEMLRRCYSSKWHERQPTYIGCSVCDEWLKFSNFKQWFDLNYVDGYELDKDVLIKGNKIYSPETSVFVPPEINSLLTKRDSKRGQYPIGVCFNKKANKFQSECRNNNGKKVYLGLFDNPEDAFQIYKDYKEALIKQVATEYLFNKKISYEVYAALYNYEVSETD